ncbi:MAG: hypothetical protein ACI9CD_000453 [Candidatus Deianiraeaceae bacterium]|jgi:hypothetical protein
MSSHKTRDVLMRLIMSVSTGGGISIVHHNVANAAEGIGTAEAQVIQSAQVNEQERLGFGEIIPSASAGTITVDDSGNVTVTGGHQVIEGTQSLGSFNVIGSEGQNVSVALPTSGFSIKHSNGVDEMPVSLQGYNIPTTIANGVATFNVGGQLAVNANQTPGVYIGNYTVTVTYS